MASPNQLILPEIAPAVCSFVVFPHPFDVALLRAFHQQPIQISNNNYSKYSMMRIHDLFLTLVDDSPMKV